MTAIDDRLERIEATLDRNENKIDQLRGQLSDYQLAVEHRVSVLETKAGLWGSVFGAVGGFLAGLLPTLFFRK